MANLIGKALSAGEKALNKEWKTALRKSGLGKSLTKSGASVSERNTILKNIKNSFDPEEDLGNIYDSLKDINSALSGGKIAPENLNSVGNFSSAFKGTSLEGKFNSSLSKLQKAKDTEIEAAKKTQEILKDVSTPIDEYHPANKITSNKPLGSQQVPQSSEKVAHSKIGKTLTEDMGMSRSEAAQYIRELRTKNPTSIKPEKTKWKGFGGNQSNTNTNINNTGYKLEGESKGTWKGKKAASADNGSGESIPNPDNPTGNPEAPTETPSKGPDAGDVKDAMDEEIANAKNNAWYNDEAARKHLANSKETDISRENVAFENKYKDISEEYKKGLGAFYEEGNLKGKVKDAGKLREYQESWGGRLQKAIDEHDEAIGAIKDRKVGVMDWVQGHDYDKAAVGIGALGFAGSVAFGGAKSNADLYSNPF